MKIIYRKTERGWQVLKRYPEYDVQVHTFFYEEFARTLARDLGKLYKAPVLIETK